jgi:hypothetical protein
MPDDAFEEDENLIGDLPLAHEPGWERLTSIQQQFVAMRTIEGMVGNGGWHAVYYNACADYLPLAASGYELIGALEQARICGDVLSTIDSDPWAGPPNTWPDPNANEAPMGSKDIGDFDDPWYALDLAELASRKAAFIGANRPEFRDPFACE